MKLPRYPKYKDSGVRWLGEVPEHWDTVPFFVVGREVYSPNTGMREDNLLSLSYGRVIAKDIQSNEGLLPESFETYQIVQPNDIVFRLTDLQNDKQSLRSAIVRERGIVTSAYVAVRPRKIIPEYLNYLLRTFDQCKVFYSMGGGLRQSLKFSEIKRLPVLFPCDEEQERIVRFLNFECEKVETLIAEQERLITLLQEKRHAIVFHAVTKGLNPHANMRRSGIEWFGDIPAHWQVGKCGFYLRILTGFAFPSNSFTYDETDTKLLRGINVSVGRIRWDEVVRWKRISGDGLQEFELNVGDIVLGMDRPLIAGGIRVAEITEDDLPCLLLQRVASLRTTSKQLLRGFFKELLSSSSFAAHFSPETTGVSVPHISPEQIANFKIPIPPPDEQTAITSFLQSEKSKLDALLACAEGSISTLEERRSALISSAISGQIDVRDYRPEEAHAVCQ